MSKLIALEFPDVAAASAEVARIGTCRVARLAADDLADALELEASRVQPAAEKVEQPEYQLGVEGQRMRSPMRFAACDAAEELASLHEHPELLSLVGELAGEAMRPSKLAYLYFGDGSDFIGLHTDLPACELTLLLGIGGEVPHLVAYPELQHRAPEDLLELAAQTSGAPAGGTPFPVRRGEIVALVGGRVPHQTPRAARREIGVIASLCYVGDGAPL